MSTIDFNNKGEFEKFRDSIQKILDPIKKADEVSPIFKDFLMKNQRTEAGRSLPDYYLVYFLFVDLLGYNNIVQMEKTAWAVKIEYNGKPFSIEHRKFGLGIFGNLADEKEAKEIADRIHKAVKAAQPFFEFIAASAANKSELNVTNNCKELFQRYEYFLKRYKSSLKKIEKSKGVKKVKKTKNSTLYTFPVVKQYSITTWNAMAVIDAFFSWTEHVFIHIAILKGTIKKGVEVAELAADEWSVKFKKAIPLDTNEVKMMYDELLEIRRQVRNFLDHGAFGKKGEAFHFHSGAGAVPLILPHQRGRAKFSLSSALIFRDDKAIEAIEKFVKLVWKGDRRPAKLYLQKYSMPVILTMAVDGQYEMAMTSNEAMMQLIEYLSYQIDRSADMDF